MFSFFHFMCLYWAFNIHHLGYPPQLCLTATWHLSHRSQGWRIHQTARRGKSRIRSSFFTANMKHDIGHMKTIQNITLFKHSLVKQDHARYLDKLAWILLICIRYRACSISNVILIFSGLLTEKSVIIPQINTQKFCSALHLVEGQTKMHVQRNWPREARLFLTSSSRAVWVCGELLWDSSCDTSEKVPGRSRKTMRPQTTWLMPWPILKTVFRASQVYFFWLETKYLEIFMLHSRGTEIILYFVFQT